MLLDSDTLFQLHDVAITAATQAGRYILAHKPNFIEHKSAGSSDASQVVTEVDHASQRLIVEALQPTVHQYDLGLLAEEDEDDGSRLIKDYFWCIDPLDGTLPFIEGRSGYAVAIALIKKDGTPVIGVVYNPQENKCYSALNEHGAYLNGEAFKPKAEKHEVFTIFHHRSLLKHPQCELILHNWQHTYELRGYTKFEYISHGGAVMNAIWTIEKQAAFYFALPKKAQGGGCIWDYAATVCIFTELGYAVSDYLGNPLMLNKSYTIFMNEVGVRYTTSIL